MPSSKRQKAGARGPQPMRSRTTRSSKARLLSDPTENTQQLTQQLRALGLYAADTLGDGNCLFRALSDQLYGTPSYHLRLRQEICDWIAAHKSRYEPFVEDERGFDVHLQCMRQQGTYGGHLELSAFAHYARRDVKVIQPGLVYVIEWFAGWDPSEIAATSGPSFEEPPSTVDSREKRRMKRDKVRADQEKIGHPYTDTSVPQRPIYVAYHDWEHFSSIRNLKGPHTGIPNVVERSGDSGPPSPIPQKGKQKPAPKQPLNPTTTKRKDRKSAQKPVNIAATSPTPPPPAPADIPLPLSRSPSPADSPEPPSSSLSTPPYPTMPSISSLLEPRPYRSPKRTFDESSASSHSETSESASKRARNLNPSSSRLSQDIAPPEVEEPEEDSDIDVDVSMVEPDADTPGLSPSGFSSESSLSPLSSPSPSPPPPEKPLTRRQRKALGLPKQRAHVGGKGASAGKIVIPGGKFKGKKNEQRAIEEEPDDEADAEWAKNGAGRVDVRGFRELKI